MLTKADIFEAKDYNLTKVDIPEWNGVVYVRGLTGEERDAYEKSFLDYGKDDSEVSLADLKIRLIIYGVTDEKGNNLFDMEDAEILNKKNGEILNKLFNAVRDVSGLGVAEEKEEEKNSDPVQVEDSVTN